MHVLQMLKMVTQSIASSSSPQRGTRISLSFWLSLLQIAIFDGMSIIFLPKLDKFRPICVPFQIATTHASSLKYFFVPTLMSECFCKSLTHVIFFLIVWGHSRLGNYFWDKGLKDFVALDLSVYHDLLLLD